MSAQYEKCKENLEILSSWYSKNISNRNEATTRLHLIDEIFFGCLDWNKSDVILEERQDNEYSDYEFKAPRSLLIVEAKKEQLYFEIPIGKKRLEYSINSLISGNTDLKKAIRQAAGYCQSRGVPFCAVTNGHQIVAFLGTREDGIPPIEGKALVFPSFDFMIENFMVLWNALSKIGIQSQYLKKKLVGTLLPELPPKLSSKISPYPGIKGRNIFQTDLQNITELVIEDIPRDEHLESTFLKECYCQHGALSQYSLVSKEIIETRYKLLFDPDFHSPTTISAVDKKGISPEIIAESLSRRPILLIGDVGSGKTSFIRYLLKVEAAEEFKNAFTFHLNLATQATLSSNLKEFVLDEIASQLNKQYNIDIFERNFVRGVYHIDLRRFSQSIYKDLKKINPKKFLEQEIQFLDKKINNKEQHLKSSLYHIAKGRKKQIVIFIDNADQRNYEIQQEAFLIAQGIAENFEASVFVAIRPETFNLSVQSGVLSGYNPKAFTISPPRVDQVIKKRLEFANRICRGDIPLRSLTNEYRVRLEKLEKVISIFLDTIRWRDDIVILIDNISYGNIRTALNIVKSFFGSGQVNISEMIDIYDRTGIYYIPLHHFLNAVIFGDTIHYDPSGPSPISNLFDISHPDPKEHFLLPLLIGFLFSYSTHHSDSGFIESKKIYEHLQGLGFTPEQIDSAIVRAYNKRLIETSNRSSHPLSKSLQKKFRVTPIGVYHITKLIYLFNYIDAMIVDTPILDDLTRSLINNVQAIDSRLERTEFFKNYLDTQWKNIESGTTFNWNETSSLLQKNIDYIRNRILSKR